MFDYLKGDYKYLHNMINMTKEYYGNIEISDEKFLHWQYFGNPSGNAYIRIAYDKEEPAGQYIVIPMMMKVKNKIVKCTLSLNTLTREKYRGKGLFTQLAEKVFLDCKKDGVKFTYGFPNQNSYPGFIRKLNFKNVGYMPLLVRPLDFESMIYKKFKNNIISKLSNLINPFFQINNEIEGEAIEINNDNVNFFDNFWNKIKDEYEVIGVRDSKYIKWRYIDIPLREYKILGIKKNENLVAYLVLRNTTIGEFDCGMIVDFLYLSSYEKEALSLLNNSLMYFEKKQMDMIGCLMNGYSKEYKLLKKLKFIKVPKKFEPQPFPVILRVHDNDYSANHDLKGWFLTMGDYDVI